MIEKEDVSVVPVRLETALTSPAGDALSTEADEGVFSDTKSSSSAKAKYELSVELPSIRKKSRLATEKTTSADNLTLGSPVDKKSERTSSPLIKDDMVNEEEEVSQP